jgi:hypothetical protein
MNQNVGAIEQRTEQIPIAALLQVQHGAAFVGIEIEKQTAMFGVGNIVEKRTAPAHDIAARRLDLDDVGAEISKQFGCPRRRYALAILDHPDAGQRAAIDGCIAAISRLRL